jgi:energy-coupling factor transporter transmembrane protein EcfT
MATAVDASACTGLDWRDLIRIIVLGIFIVFIVIVILLVLFVFLILLILFIVLLLVVEFALLWRMFTRFSAVDLGWMCLRLLCGCSRAARSADDGTVLVELDRTRKRTGTRRRGMGAARGNVALLDVRVLL